MRKNLTEHPNVLTPLAMRLPSALRWAFPKAAILFALIIVGLLIVAIEGSAGVGMVEFLHGVLVAFGVGVAGFLYATHIDLSAESDAIRYEMRRILDGKNPYRRSADDEVEPILANGRNLHLPGFLESYRKASRGEPLLDRDFWGWYFKDANGVRISDYIDPRG